MIKYSFCEWELGDEGFGTSKLGEFGQSSYFLFPHP